MRKQKGYIEEGTLMFLFIMGVIVFVGALFILSMMWDSHICSTKAHLMGLESKWSMSTDCMVKVGDRWAPFSFIRIVDNKVIIQGDGEE